MRLLGWEDSLVGKAPVVQVRGPEFESFSFARCKEYWR